MSEKIVKEKELIEGAPINRIDRLTRPIGTVKQTILEGIEKPTFAPKISKKSSKLALRGHFYSNDFSGNRQTESDIEIDCKSDPDCQADGESGYISEDLTGCTASMYDRTSRWENRRLEKINRDREMMETEKMKGCTFMPQLHAASAQNFVVDSRQHYLERTSVSFF